MENTNNGSLIQICSTACWCIASILLTLKSLHKMYSLTNHWVMEYTKDAILVCSHFSRFVFGILQFKDLRHCATRDSLHEVRVMAEHDAKDRCLGRSQLSTCANISDVIKDCDGMPQTGRIEEYFFGMIHSTKTHSCLVLCEPKTQMLIINWVDWTMRWVDPKH